MAVSKTNILLNPSKDKENRLPKTGSQAASNSNLQTGHKAYNPTIKVAVEAIKAQFLAALPFFKKKVSIALTTGINMSNKGIILFRINLNYSY